MLHRIQPPLVPPTVYSFEPPFSAFDFVESQFEGCRSIRRAFSLARAHGSCETVVVERIASVGLIADDNEELAGLGFVGGTICYRVSFWTRQMESPDEIGSADSSELLGYFIAKCDGEDDTNMRWYVFDSVFRKYDHPHNCVARAANYRVCIGPKIFEISGVLYCQQNGLNKSCAHVALRSLLSRIVADGDIAYSKINEIVGSCIDGESQCRPADGLSVQQIKAVLDAFDVSYSDMDYVAAEDSGIADIRIRHPYQNDLYSAVESGFGALLGFKLADPTQKHIIPFYGHTFNKDTWVTDAETSYFKIGSSAGYIPSVNWTSSFIGHDDNFGSNFCVPRLYVKPEQVDYVAALYPKGVRLTDSALVGLALLILSELYPHIPQDNKWLSRLKSAFSRNVPEIVFRTVCVESSKYFDALEEEVDWEGRRENAPLVDALRTIQFPRFFQVVEVSVPQLFAANEHKIGDIVFDASAEMPSDCAAINDLPFLFARLPQVYFLPDRCAEGDNHFSTVPSSIVSHVRVLIDY